MRLSIGIALLPTDYLAPSLVQEPTFELYGARLESVSWRGACSALWSRWTAYRPWNGRSNHTGGMELAGRGGPSLQLFVALLAAHIGGAIFHHAIRKDGTLMRML